MARKRGNPNWGKKMEFPMPQMETEFEKALRAFGLAAAEESIVASSASFRRWALNNCRKRYIPESLLLAVGIAVELELDA